MEKRYDSEYSILQDILEEVKKGGGGSCNLQEISTTVTTNGLTVINPDEGFDGISKANITVSVPEPYLVPLEVTKNGTYVPGMDEDGFSDVTVNVPVPTLSILEAVENKTYTAPDGTAYNQVNVNVPTGGASFDWEGTGYTPANSAKLDQSYLAKQQADIDYTKQKYAEWDPSRTSAENLYQFDRKLVYAPNIDMNNVINMSHIFNYCEQLTALPDGFNCPNALYADYAFSNCKSLTTLPENFSCPKITTAQFMFASTKLTSLPTGFNCPDIKDAWAMFESAPLTTLPEGFSFPNATNTSRVFNSCGNLKSLPDGFSCPNATNLSDMFSGCGDLKSLPDSFDCPEATNVMQMFSGCSSLHSLPKMNFGKVTNINYFFGYADPRALKALGGFTGLKIDWNDNNGLARCPNLSEQAVLNVINELADVKALGETHTIKFHANSLALLSDAEKQVAIDKGWNLIS